MEGQNTNKPKKNIIAAAIAGIIAIGATITGIVVWTRQAELANYDIDPGEPTYYRDENHSEMLDILANIRNDMSKDELHEVLKLGGFSENYIHMDGDSGYISATDIILGNDYTGFDLEFITFDIVAAEEDYELDYIENITFHGYRGEAYDEIYEADGDEFVHFSATTGITNSYEELDDAIYDYLAYLD